MQTVLLVEDYSQFLTMHYIKSVKLTQEMLDEGKWKNSCMSQSLYKVCLNAIKALSELPFPSMFFLRVDEVDKVMAFPVGGFRCYLFLNEDDFYDAKGKVVFNQDKCIAEIPGEGKGSATVLGWLQKMGNDFPLNEIDRLTVDWWVEFFSKRIQRHIKNQIDNQERIKKQANQESLRLKNLLNATEQAFLSKEAVS